MSVFFTLMSCTGKRYVFYKQEVLWIREPKVPLRIFDKLKNEIKKFIIRFCFYNNMKNEIQIIGYYFHVKIDFCFEFLMLCFIFHFHKKWKTKYSSFFSFFILMKELKNELLKQIKINFLTVFASMISRLFKSKFELIPLRFSAVQ